MQLSFIDRATVTMTIKDADTYAIAGQTTNPVKLGVIAGKLTKNHYDWGTFNLNGNNGLTTLQLIGKLEDTTNSSDISKRWAKLNTADIASTVAGSHLYVDGVSNNGTGGTPIFGLNVCSGRQQDKYVGLDITGTTPAWNCNDESNNGQHSGVGDVSTQSIRNLQTNFDAPSFANANITHVANGDASKLISVFKDDKVDEDSFVWCSTGTKFALQSCTKPRDGYVINKPQSYFLTDQLVDAPVTSSTKSSFTLVVAGSKSSVASKGGAAGSLQPPAGTGEDDAELDCAGGSLSWIVCPVIQLASDAASKLDDFITGTLNIDPSQTFDADGYYTAWNLFRVLATGMLVIGGLVMVASQALGFEFLDAYTVRKTLPRLIIAIIGMSLSWPLMRFVVEFFNTFGHDVKGLIEGPFSTIGGTVNPGIGVGSSLAAILGSVALAAIYGPAALLFIASGLLGLFTAFVVLVIRQIGVTIAIIVAPIAIACYILPNTQKVWNIWRENFLGLMMMFPIVMAFISAGHVFAIVSLKHGGGISQIIGLFAYFAPYFLLPLAFRMATGIIGNLSGMVNDRSKGVFDRMKNVRNNSAKDRHQRRMNDQLSTGRFGSAYRRLGSVGTPGSGALSMTQQGRANYAELRRKHMQGVADEALKADNGRAGGDDDATALAVRHGMTRARFLQEYQTRTGRDAAAAAASLALVERGFGAQMGTEAMQVAAFKARSASSTAYRPGAAGAQDRINEGAALINSGLMTAADATAAGKGNRARTDISGAGFSTQMSAFSNAAASLNSGGPGMVEQQANNLLDRTVEEADPGDILAGNTRTIESLAPSMTRSLQRNMQARDEALARGDTQDAEQFDLQVNRDLGQIAGIQDNLNRTSKQKAGMFADAVNGQLFTRADGTQTTVRQMVQEAASRPADAHGVQTFLEVRKEYGSAGAAHAAGGAVVQEEEH